MISKYLYFFVNFLGIILFKKIFTLFYINNQFILKLCKMIKII